MRPFFAADRDHRENDLACRYNVIEYYIVKAVFWQNEHNRVSPLLFAC